jgi:hypothetical protein
MKSLKETVKETIENVREYFVCVYYAAQTYPLVYVSYGITIGTLCGVSLYYTYRLRRVEHEFARRYAEWIKKKGTPRTTITPPLEDLTRGLERQQLEEKRQFPDVKLPGQRES